MRFLCRLAIIVGVWLRVGLVGQPVQAQTGDWAIPNGRFFTQAVNGRAGFSVVDDEQARFWSEYQRLGGAQSVGYPISRRFTYDGFTTQAFQKLVLQWRPEVNQAWPVNVFDELSLAGHDVRLLETRQTPHPLVGFDPSGASWAQVVTARQGLLAANPAIRARYFSVGNPLNVFGLPTSRVEDMGNHYALRTQRAVFQQWKEAVPWAAAGQVTIANGGDIAKELGWLPMNALTAEQVPESVPAVWSTYDLLLDSNIPGRLYAFQRAPNPPRERLMVSQDLGDRWQPFAGGLPAEPGCTYNVALDPNRQEGLLANTCDGFYRWAEGRWSQVSGEGGTLAVTPGNPEQLWITTSSEVLLSNDGGRRWGTAASNLNGGTMGYGYPGDLIVVAGRPTLAFAMLTVGRSGTSILRAAPGGEWVALPKPHDLMMLPFSVAYDPDSGALYLAGRTGQVWRIPNPTEPEPAAVRWEIIATLGPPESSSLAMLAAGQGSLFILDPTGHPARSQDGGRTWQRLTIAP